jgi:hypothetical protein
VASEAPGASGLAPLAGHPVAGGAAIGRDGIGGEALPETDGRWRQSGLETAIDRWPR